MSDSFFDDFLFSKSSSLKHFLETYNVKLTDLLQNVVKSLIFVIVIIGFDGWWSEKDVVSQNFDIFRCFLHGLINIEVL